MTPAMNEDSLDRGWPCIPLGDLAAPEPNAITDGPFGSKLKSAHYTSSGPRVVRLQNIGEGEFVDAKAHISEDHYSTLLKHRVFPGDLVIAALGENPPRACLIPESLGPAIVKADCIRFKAGPRVLPAYLNYVLNSPPLRRHAKSIVHGVGRPRLNLAEIRALPIPVAPLETQYRIVEFLDAQVSRLSVGVAILNRLEDALAVYRAAVLKAAWEGRLVPTEAELARQAGRPGDFESGEELLVRIVEERRRNWAGKGKYKQPVAARPEAGDRRPEGWCCATVDQVARVALGKMLDKQKHRSGRLLPYLRNINVRWGRIDSEDVSEMYFEEDEYERYSVQDGDLLVCEGGEPGRAAVWRGDRKRMMYQKALHRVRAEHGVEPDYLVVVLEYLARSGALEEWFTGSTIKHFTRESFLQLPIRLPPTAEQRRIVGEVERRLSVVAEVGSAIAANVNRAAALKQAVLEQAFGESRSNGVSGTVLAYP